MRRAEHEVMYRLEDHYWWFVGRRTIIRRLLPRTPPGEGPLRVIDVGCGTGRNLLLLEDFGRAVGVDPSEDALALCRQRGLTCLCAAIAERLPFADDSVDLVTAFEILEHLDDDALGLTEIARVLKPGGWAFLTVPAYQFLWSEHDEALDHRRRYTAGEVRKLVEGAGLRVEKLSYCIMFLFVPILVFRLLQRLVRRPRKGGDASTAHIPMPGPISRLFVWLLRIEAAMLTRMSLPIGVTVICLARLDSGASSSLVDDGKERVRASGSRDVSR